LKKKKLPKMVGSSGDRSRRMAVVGVKEVVVEEEALEEEDGWV